MASHASQQDHYEILGVSRTATTDEIKTAYRALVLQHHPDRARTNDEQLKSTRTGVPEDIIHINAAYDILSNDSRRAQYDVQRYGSSSVEGASVPSSTNYQGMTAKDVETLFAGLNTFERFSTAKYQSIRPNTTIGRRTISLNERKALRASKLPSSNASVAWLTLPVALVALWGVSIYAVKNNAKSPRTNQRQ